MPIYAQTCIQLWNELEALGWDDRDLALVHRCYGLSMQLFAGWYRSSGKTFISHLVGTASILAGIGEPSRTVGAGILHAAYANGDFGDGKLHRATPGRRRVVREAVGGEVEELVAAYHALQWTPEKMAALTGSASALADLETRVVLIRLANELEENLDFGLPYCGESKRHDYAGHRSEALVNLAVAIEQPRLAAELEAAHRATASAHANPALPPWADAGSFQRIPSSARLRLAVKVRGWAARLLAR